MNAPTTDVVEQDTQPMPVSETLPPGTGLSSEAGVWLVPATVFAAIGTGLWLRETAPHLRYELTFSGLGLVMLGCAVIVVVVLARGPQT